MRVLHLSLIAVFWFWLVVSSSREVGATSDVEERNGAEIKPGMKLPRIFNFENYKRMFHKLYTGFLEELVRHKIVLGRIFESFMSLFMFKLGQTTHFLRINHMSDDTPEERRRRYMRKGPRDRSNISRKQASREVLMTDESELISEFNRIEENKEKTGYRELAKEFEELSNEASVRRKRNSLAHPSEPDLVETKISELIQPRSSENSSYKSSQLEQKLTARVPSNNPRHPRQLELASSFSGSIEDEAIKLRELSQLASEKSEPHLDSIVDEAIASSVEQYDNKENRLPDEVFVDHRKKNCFVPVKNQGRCGSCYAFTSVTLYEYLFCLETGRLVPLSEQYIVDCGGRADLGACEGAHIDSTMKFMEEFGMELAADYPYLGKNGTCPYDTNTSPDKMGAIKVDKKDAAKIYDLKDLDYLLAYSPVAVVVELANDFKEYGGGVDLGEKCLESENVHAMLIVGSGRENGIEYYLFRNSHGLDWGEEGYYKLAKSSMDRCIYEADLYTTTATFKLYAKMTRSKTNQIFNRPSNMVPKNKKHYKKRS